MTFDPNVTKPEGHDEWQQLVLHLLRNIQHGSLFCTYIKELDGMMFITRGPETKQMYQYIHKRLQRSRLKVGQRSGTIGG